MGKMPSMTVPVMAEAIPSLRAGDLKKCPQDSISPDNPHQMELVDFIDLPAGPLAVTEEGKNKREQVPRT